MDSMYDLFGKAAALRGRSGTQEELNRLGARDLKRRILGFCGKKTVLNLIELTNIFLEMRIINSEDEFDDKFRDKLYCTWKTGDGHSGRWLVGNQFPMDQTHRETISSSRAFDYLCFHSAISSGNVPGCEVFVYKENHHYSD